MAELTIKVPHKKRDRVAYNRQWYLDNQERHLERCADYRNQNREKTRIDSKNYYVRVRAELVEKLGCACVKCGFNDIRALQIDHINGGGSKERTSHSRGAGLYRKMLKMYEAEPDDFHSKYQLLCANCNWIKRAENREFRKE